MPTRTILIFYVTVGYGHRRAALALKKSLNLLAPDIRVVCLDIFELWPAWVGRLLVNGYRVFIRLFPRLWAFLYDHQTIKKRLSRLLLWLYRSCRGRIGLLLEELKPVAAVSTQAFPAGILAVYKKDRNLRLPLVAVPTDFAVHSYWFDEMVDLYLLPSERSRTGLIARGLPPDRIRVSGIPVDEEFTRPHQPGMIKRKYGLEPKLPAILLMGGGEGRIRMEKLIRELDKIHRYFQIAALTGRNLKELSRLKRLLPTLSHPLRIFGFTEKVGELMEAVDLIVTKPGGLTLAEVLVKSRPVVLIDPLPGQEELNARFLLENGAAIWAEDEKRAADITEKLLNDKSLRKSLIAEMKKITRPRSAETAARRILELVGP